ncbi:ATP-binding protein [Ravibacter arvi]|uniref:ATP-binding protein n=1 Tax=Ravibacter arvi TaxID=2051041 RepID=UPI0031E7A8AF
MPIAALTVTRSCACRTADAADCSFITRNENLLIIGSTGIGKSYVAMAIRLVSRVTVYFTRVLPNCSPA